MDCWNQALWCAFHREVISGNEWHAPSPIVQEFRMLYVLGIKNMHLLLDGNFELRYVLHVEHILAGSTNWVLFVHFHVSLLQVLFRLPRRLL